MTRTALYGFVSVLPLLVLYEALILLANRGQAAQVRISAEIWLKRLIPSFGLSAMHVLAAVVLVIGVVIFLRERKKAIPLRPRYIGWMLAESTVYAVVLAFLVAGVVGMLFAAAPPGQPAPGLLAQLALSLGAGLYEELFFRVLLVGGLYLGLKRLLPRPLYAYVVAAVVGALLFSFVHYVGVYGDAFTLASFTFRFLFGLALNGVFLVRGFGVAAWTHALYDVMVVTGVFG